MIDKRFVDVVVAPNGFPATGCKPRDPVCSLPAYEDVFEARSHDIVIVEKT